MAPQPARERSPKDRLTILWREFLDQGFPPRSRQPQCDPLYNELVQTDRYISQLVEDLLAGEPVDPGEILVPTEFEARLAEAAHGSHPAAREIQRYYEHCTRLRQIATLARVLARR